MLGGQGCDQVSEGPEPAGRGYRGQRGCRSVCSYAEARYLGLWNIMALWVPLLGNLLCVSLIGQGNKT